MHHIQAKLETTPGTPVQHAAFVAAADESLLEAGRRAGFTFPQSCRNGNCFRCEGKLLRGVVENIRTHETITAATSAATILPCLVAARSDCALHVAGVYAPGELPVVEVAAQIVQVKALTEHVSRAHLRLPAGKHLKRLAGQYLEILEGDNAYAFSIASPPESGREIELHIRHGTDNPSSLQVMALLQREPVVMLRLPQGDCTLIAEPRLPLLLLAGSTGFSQAKAFIEHAIAQRWRIPIALYWGVRTPADLYLDKLPVEWARTHDNICYVPVVSNTAGGQTGYRTGLVHEAVLADAPDFSNLLVYACGSPPMVHAAYDAFVARGLPPDRLFSDVFAWAPREEK